MDRNLQPVVGVFPTEYSCLEDASENCTQASLFAELPHRGVLILTDVMNHSLSDGVSLTLPQVVRLGPMYVPGSAVAGTLRHVICIPNYSCRHFIYLLFKTLLLVPAL